MAHKGYIKIFIIFLSVLCVSLTLALCGNIFLPRIIENKITEILLSLTEEKNTEFKIKTLSFTSAEVSCRITEPLEKGRRRSVTNIGSMEIHFSPLALFREKRIESIEIENCDIVAEYDENGQFSLPAWDLFAKKITTMKGNEPNQTDEGVEASESVEKDGTESCLAVNSLEDLNQKIPVQIGRISFSGEVMIESRTEEGINLISIPYGFVLLTDEKDGWNQLQLKFFAINSVNNISFQVNYNHHTGLFKFSTNHLTCSSMALPSMLRDFLPRGMRMEFSLTGEAEVNLSELKIQPGMQFSGKMQMTYRHKESGFVSNSSFDFSVSMKDLNCIEFKISEFQGKYDDMSFSFNDIEGNYFISKKMIQGFFNLKFTDSEAARFYYAATFKDENGLQANLKMLNQPNLKLKYKGIDYSLSPFNLSAEYLGSNGDSTATFSCDAKNLSVLKEQLSVASAQLKLQAAMNWSDSAKSAKLEANLNENTVKFNDMSGTMQNLSCEISSQDFKSFQLATKLKEFNFNEESKGISYQAPDLICNGVFSNGGISGESICETSRFIMDSTMKVEANGISWRFPFVYTIANTSSSPKEANESDNEGMESTNPVQNKKVDEFQLGNFSVQSILYQDVPVASFAGQIGWNEDMASVISKDLTVCSTHSSVQASLKPFQGLSLCCDVEFPEQPIQFSDAILQLFPQLASISCDGNFSAKARYELQDGKNTGYAKLNLHDANVALPEKNLQVNGIDFEFEIPDLARLQSSPGQKISFKSLKFDKIETENGVATYHMMSPREWQLENTALNWCGGHIRLGGLVFRADQPISEAVLYCDRLDLARFLTQTGLGNISGIGSINGTIPISITPKNILFNDAFLFSTPGEEGVIQGEVNQKLLNEENGIEMELARDALKDFSYSWVRIQIITTGEDKDNLALKLEVNGKPNKLLYYTFDEGAGSFIKTGIPAHFQGIQLNVNVNIMAKNILDFVDDFKKIFSNKQLDIGAF